MMMMMIIAVLCDNAYMCLPFVCHSSILYEGRLINKLQNSVILLVLQILKIQNIRFVGNFVLNMCRNFFDDDIIVTSSDHRTPSTHVSFSPPVIYHNSQMTSSIGTKK